ncbi:hypothetical protein ACHAWU_002635 [Discostella pseudostelligera]|uniref:Uncharacterized protein n=1 Tax=Discostella pseudostelligera TaxID=259834 RepID=A0ABD3LZY7_9STRA
MSRTDGRKLVALAATATVAAIGIGTIYLPFIADRDKLRGLFEEGEQAMPEGARREIQKILKAERAEAELQQRQQLQQQQQLDNIQREEEVQQQQHQHQQQQQQRQRASAGSMWNSFRRNA